MWTRARTRLRTPAPTPTPPKHAGVVVGNYRCSLAGVDLNRVWNVSAQILGF